MTMTAHTHTHTQPPCHWMTQRLRALTLSSRISKTVVCFTELHSSFLPPQLNSLNLGDFFLFLSFLKPTTEKKKKKRPDVKHTNPHRVKTCAETLALTFWIHYSKKANLWPVVGVRSRKHNDLSLKFNKSPQFHLRIHIHKLQMRLA